jgi:hypothetical protein
MTLVFAHMTWLLSAPPVGVPPLGIPQDQWFS